MQVAIPATLMTLAACSRLTIENCDQIEVGMSYAAVEKVLGEPAKYDDMLGVRKCMWSVEERQIMVSFAGDRVAIRAATGLK